MERCQAVITELCDELIGKVRPRVLVRGNAVLCGRPRREHEVCPCRADRERGVKPPRLCACSGPIQHPYEERA